LVAFTQPAWAAGVAVLFDPASGILTAYVGYPERIPERARGAIAEAITRANYGYVGACLELDFGNGDLRSRAALLIDASDASPDQVRDLVETAVDFCTKFSPAITEVLAEGSPRRPDIHASLRGSLRGRIQLDAGTIDLEHALKSSNHLEGVPRSLLRGRREQRLEKRLQLVGRVDGPP
jgi:hypothetical protein